MNKLVYNFVTKYQPNLSEVGGKGLSLIQSTKNSFPVPPGFVLTVAFFADWFKELSAKFEFSSITNYNEKEIKEFADKLKEYSKSLKLTEEQLTLIEPQLKKFGKNPIFAVRSSSPEEDLEGASFAGGYETMLGVTTDKLNEAILEVFISCLDYRVFLYKKENGFDITAPKIAVVIQQQIASEVSGVGFSINPMNNCFDEVFINANWGLGETVVSGTVTPDSFSLNKNSLRVTSKHIGKKERSLWLNDEGGVSEKKEFQSKKQTLLAPALKELTKLITNVEKVYGKPMDTEWAFAKDRLYLLQARPITAFVPISDKMLSKPEEQKYLYQDMTISVQGLHKPMSYFSSSLFNKAIGEIGSYFFKKPIKLDPQKSLAWVDNGKLYLNHSNFLSIKSKEQIVELAKNMDFIAAATLNEIDELEYKADNITKKQVKKFIAKVGIKTVPFILRGALFPKLTTKINEKKFKKFEYELAELYNNKTVSLSNFISQAIQKWIKLTVQNCGPLSLSARAIFDKYCSKLKDISQKDKEALLLALPHNVTTDMDLALAKLASLIPEELSEKEFLDKLSKNTLPKEIQNSWNSFIDKYGHRCPVELDVSTPRYEETPEKLTALIFPMKEHAKSEEARFQKQVEKREEKYEEVLKTMKENSGFLKTSIFKFIYRYALNYAGHRETHKHYIILVIHLIRHKLLEVATKLEATKQISDKNIIFDLTIKNIEDAIKDSSLKLDDIAEENTKFINKLSKVNNPTIFDSRGTILKPPAPEVKEGEVLGMPVSSGIATGKVKVMHTPTEKPFNKGDILVAKATDPAWTPLFINASAVILEIGGALQHGALVAREYGLPCVSGIEDVLDKWNDGDEIEVNGDTGVIKSL